MNLCFVGYGSIAEEHARAFRALGGTTFHTVVGRVPESTEAFAREHGFGRWTLDLDEALADPAIEAVVITSPSALHAPQAQAALVAGKHVLVEIPLAMSEAETVALRDLAEERGRVLMVCHTQRYFPELRELRRRIAAGEFHPHHVVCRWFFLRRANVNWKGRQRSWTDNLLWHHACHVVDAVLWLLDEREPRAIAGQFGPPHPELGIPLDLDLHFLAGSVPVQIAMSYNSPWSLHDYCFIGQETTLVYSGSALRDQHGILYQASERRPIQAQNAAFLRAVREGSAPEVGAAEVLPAMRVLQAVEDRGTRA